MNTHSDMSPVPSKEQMAYADWLFYGCWIGLVVMLITYAVYVSGILIPHVPLERMSEYWNEPVSTYLAKAQAPIGWGWVALLGQGDFVNFVGVVFLAGLSIICYIRILPGLLAKKDMIYFTLAVLQVLVLVFAASGILGSGAH
ncbi:MAG: DUF1634 domain-containing protein [Deltaproteobacteria bacterium]|jgi:hypothetical protein|nr:DUF1634 domain-containing protein [Deltaproteobacteria bacterium]